MHDIQVTMRLSQQEKIFAYGMVAIDGGIRFMVQLRKNKDGEMFLGYPRREHCGEWTDVVRPDEVLKEELEKAVFEAARNEIRSGLYLPEIEEVTVTVLPNDQKHKVQICGVASVKICGMTITGITIKEGKEGLFINMPQYRQADGTYKDLIYATSKELQQRIATVVIDRYQKKRSGENDNFH